MLFSVTQLPRFQTHPLSLNYSRTHTHPQDNKGLHYYCIWQPPHRTTCESRTNRVRRRLHLACMFVSIQNECGKSEVKAGWGGQCGCESNIFGPENVYLCFASEVEHLVTLVLSHDLNTMTAGLSLK